MLRDWMLVGGGLLAVAFVFLLLPLMAQAVQRHRRGLVDWDIERDEHVRQAICRQIDMAATAAMVDMARYVAARRRSPAGDNGTDYLREQEW